MKLQITPIAIVRENNAIYKFITLQKDLKRVAFSVRMFSDKERCRLWDQQRESKFDHFPTNMTAQRVTLYNSSESTLKMHVVQNSFQILHIFYFFKNPPDVLTMKKHKSYQHH